MGAITEVAAEPLIDRVAHKYSRLNTSVEVVCIEGEKRTVAPMLFTAMPGSTREKRVSCVSDATLVSGSRKFSSAPLLRSVAIQW